MEHQPTSSLTFGYARQMKHLCSYFRVARKDERGRMVCFDLGGPVKVAPPSRYSATTDRAGMLKRHATNKPFAMGVAVFSVGTLLGMPATLWMPFSKQESTRNLVLDHVWSRSTHRLRSTYVR